MYEVSYHQYLVHCSNVILQMNQTSETMFARYPDEQVFFLQVYTARANLAPLVLSRTFEITRCRSLLHSGIIRDKISYKLPSASCVRYALQRTNASYRQ